MQRLNTKHVNHVETLCMRQLLSVPQPCQRDNTHVVLFTLNTACLHCVDVVSSRTTLLRPSFFEYEEIASGLEVAHLPRYAVET